MPQSIFIRTHTHTPKCPEWHQPLTSILRKTSLRHKLRPESTGLIANPETRGAHSLQKACDSSTLNLRLSCQAYGPSSTGALTKPEALSMIGRRGGDRQGISDDTWAASLKRKDSATNFFGVTHENARKQQHHHLHSTCHHTLGFMQHP